jgi:hypothetical protein
MGSYLRVLQVFLTLHSFSVTLFTLGLRLFYSTANKLNSPSQECDSNDFLYDSYGDHLQTCQTKSAASQVHEWVVYKLGALLGSVGRRVKTGSRQ